jgi:peptide/nickel transport system permease protein
MKNTKITKKDDTVSKQIVTDAYNASDVEEHISVATQWQLIWWRFKKHKLAMAGAILVIIYYFVVIFAEFLAYANPLTSEAYRSYMPPQRVHFFYKGRFFPHVYAVEGVRDPVTFKRVYTFNSNKKLPIVLFGHGFEYKLLGIIPTDIHLFGIIGAQAEEVPFLFGSDISGRDLYSRLIFATRTSMTIGLVGVILSLFFGILLGGLSGYFGGFIDTVIQRVIEILRSIPTIPLWMALTAALPRTWTIDKIYFAITIILSLVGWTELARVVRGRFLGLREEDFILAAELVGASQPRIIFRHMVPSFLSHIIAATTLALPTMIISETSLSFLGLGLRPPAISWGTLLQDAQSIESLAISPWLLIPAIPVIIVILAFNFFGDGLRDAADPYG